MAELLVNQFFQRPFFDQLGSAISLSYPPWHQQAFMTDIYNNGWDDLTLTQRMARISQVLRKHLPEDYAEALQILFGASRSAEGFNGMVFSDFVGQFGLHDPEMSLDALEQFTQIGSAEFAIRQFILHHEQLTMARMLDWTGHSNEHVRRLASEGCRPRLPWAVALPKYKKDPSPVVPILERLKDDPSLYVRKSVANHLNDLTKDNPERVLDLVESWQQGASTHTQWIIKHALRSLVKLGDPRALKVLGFDAAEVKVSNLTIQSPTVVLGGFLDFDLELVNRGKEEAQVVVDFVIHFMKANGSLAPKVFKLKNLKMSAGERITLSKSHPIKPITTRKYYAGKHKLAIQINGQVLKEAIFKLLTS